MPSSHILRLLVLLSHVLPPRTIPTQVHTTTIARTIMTTTQPDYLKTSTGDAWSNQAAEYSSMMLTGPMLPLIRVMYKHMQSHHPFSSATTILDIGSGPGSATYTLLNDHAADIASDAKILATDFSEGMVEQVKQLKAKKTAELDGGPAKNLWGRVEATVMNAQDLSPVADSSISHASASLVLFMVPDSGKALSEILRVLEPGGVMSCSSWKRATWMNLAMEAAGRDADSFKLPARWDNVDGTRKILEDAGFVDVKVEEVETCLKFEDAGRLAEWFLGSKNPPLLALLKDLSEEQRIQAQATLAKLFEERKDERLGGVAGVGIVASGRKGSK